MKLLLPALLFAVCSHAPAAGEKLTFFGTPLDPTPAEKLAENSTVKPSDGEDPATAPPVELEPELEALEKKIRAGEDVLREIFDKKIQDVRKILVEELAKVEESAAASKRAEHAEFLKKKRSFLTAGIPIILDFKEGEPPEWQFLVKSAQPQLEKWRQEHRLQSAKVAGMLRDELKQAAKTLEARKNPADAARAAQMARSLQPWFDLRGNLWGGKATMSDLAGAHGGGRFYQVPGEGGILTGFYYTTWHSCIGSLTPIYMTARGRIKGPTLGKQRSAVKRIEALPGYAVAGIIPATSDRLNTLRIVFMRLKENEAGFDPKFRYVSEVFGGKGGKEEKTIGENGRLVTGICGRSGDDIDAIGLVQVE